MPRKPKELKRRKTDNPDDAYAIPTVSVAKCVVCGLTNSEAKESGTELIFSPIDKDNHSFVCENCFDDFCEVCRKMKTKFMTHRNYRIKEDKFSQICVECYIKKCDEIIQMDKEYEVKLSEKM